MATILLQPIANSLFRLRITVHTLHREAAKQHELAAQSHRTASEHNEKGDNATGNWHTQRALEYSNRAYELAHDAHNKSGKIGSL
jgi:hypothetical protein